MMKMRKIFLLLICSLASISASAFECERPASQAEMESFTTIFWGEVISGPLSSIEFVQMFSALDEPNAQRYYKLWKKYKEIVGNKYTVRITSSYRGHFESGEIAVVKLSDISNFLERKNYLIFSDKQHNEFEVDDCYVVQVTENGLDYLRRLDGFPAFTELRDNGLLPGYRPLSEPNMGKDKK